MSSVLRLVWLYFTGTTAARWLSAAGILMCLFSVYAVTSFPQSGVMMAFAMGGQLSFFLGSAFMPLMFGRLAKAQSAALRPLSRLKLLASAMLTVAIVSLPIGLLTPLAFVSGVAGEVAELVKNPGLLDYTINLALITYTSACVLAGWLYVAMWFVSSQRDLMGAAKGALVIAILLLLPAQEIRELSVSLARNLQQLALVWVVFSVAFLAWPKLRRRYRDSRKTGSSSGKTSSAADRVSGKEVDLILGTSRPWLLAAGFMVPVLFASRASKTDATMWLFFLTVSSISVAAISGQAAERSRALWLRARGSRSELFTQAERSLWRHNGLIIALVVMMFLILGYADYSALFIAIGVPLLVLSVLSSSYLGMMMTRGLGWLEITLGASLVLTLMWVALLAGVLKADLVMVAALELMLAAATITFRTMAKYRWARLDWSQCRPVRVRVARGR
jgi:hypothetical protein